MATEIITRVGYCPLCARNHEPKGGHLFLAHGTTSNRYKVVEADHNGRIGFTPHIYKGKLFENNVIVEIACSMYGCGCDKRLEKDVWFFFIKEWRKEVWSIERWKALVLYHDKNYEI